MRASGGLEKGGDELGFKIGARITFLCNREVRKDRITSGFVKEESMTSGASPYHNGPYPRPKAFKMP